MSPGFIIGELVALSCSAAGLLVPPLRCRCPPSAHGWIARILRAFQADQHKVFISFSNVVGAWHPSSVHSISELIVKILHDFNYWLTAP